LTEKTLGISNSYDVCVYPSKLPETESEIIIARKATPGLLEKLENGAKVLLVPEEGYDYERTTFTTPFWSTILFDYQVKTLGILCDPEHPVFNSFPTDYYTNWQWWELLRDTRSARLNKTSKGYTPIVQVIDHPVRNDKLGGLMETKVGKGKLFVCTFDILSDPENRFVARQLKYSILNYMDSREFDPADVKGLKELFFDYNNPVEYQQIVTDNESSSHPVIFAFDEDANTYYQTMNAGKEVQIKVFFPKERYVTGCTFITKDKEHSPGNFKIYVSNDHNNKGEPVISGNVKEKDSFDAISWDNGFTIQKGKKGKYVTIVFAPVKDGDGIIKLNEFGWIFGD
jgi:hypothetical protein